MKRLALLFGAALFVAGCNEELTPPSLAKPSAGAPQAAGPALPIPTSCTGCVLDPTAFVQLGVRLPYNREFTADPSQEYLLTVQDDDQPATSAGLTLNGVTVVRGEALIGASVSELTVPVRLNAANRLTVNLVGAVGARVTVWIAVRQGQLAIASKSSIGQTGRPFPTPFVIEVQDAAGNRIQGATDPITAAIATGQGTLLGTTTVSAVDGRATFANLAFQGEGSVTLQFAVPRLAPVQADVRAVAYSTVLDPTVFDLLPEPAAQAAGRYTFSLRGTAPTILPGQVVVGTQGGGFLRRVLSATQSGSFLTLTTASASLEDLGMPVTFSDTIPVDLSQAVVAANHSVQLSGSSVSALAGTGLTISRPGLSVALGSGISFRFNTLDFDFQKPSLIRTFTYDQYGKLKLVEAEYIGTATLTAQYTLTAARSLTVTRSFPLLPPTCGRALCITLPPIVVPTPWGIPFLIPNTLDLDLTLNVGFAAQQGGSVTGSFTVTGSLGGKASYSPAGGLAMSKVATLNAASNPFSTTNPQVGVKASAAVMVEAEWNLFSAGGPYVGAGPLVQVAATYQVALNQVDIDCDLGIRLAGGIRAHIFQIINVTVTAPTLDFLLKRFCHYTIPQALPDLTPTLVTGPSTGQSGQSVPVAVTAKNAGAGSVGGGWLGEIRLSANQTCTSSTIDPLALAYTETNALSPGQTTTSTRTATIPSNITPGRYFWCVILDPAGGTVSESDEGNNALIGNAIDISAGSTSLLYTDDFSHGLGNWVQRGFGGSWSIQNGALVGEYDYGCGSPPCSQSQLLLTNSLQPTVTDWTAEAQFTSSFYNAYSRYLAQLAFSVWVSDNEKVQFSVSHNSSPFSPLPSTLSDVAFSVQRYPWTQVVFGQPTVSPWNPAQLNTVRLQKRGNQYTLYFNGQLLTTTTLSFSAAPFIGFNVYGQTVVDNFRLTTP